MKERLSGIAWGLLVAALVYAQFSTWSHARETNKFIRQIRDAIATPAAQREG